MDYENLCLCLADSETEVDVIPNTYKELVFGITLPTGNILVVSKIIGQQLATNKVILNLPLLRS